MNRPHIRANTDKLYPCTNCGAQGNIVREGDTPELKRLKCLRCNFMYSAADSIAAVEAGEVPDGPPKLQPTPTPPPPSRDGDRSPAAHPSGHESGAASIQRGIQAPRTLRYLVVAKDRSTYEFANAKQLKGVVFQWEAKGASYEVFELSPKEVTAKVDIK